MHHVACYLYAEGWILRSGGANGADAAFEQAVDHMVREAFAPDRISLPAKQIYLPWRGFNNSRSELHPGRIPFTPQEQSCAAHFHPAWDKCSPSAKLMHQRNVRQIVGSHAVDGENLVLSAFVVCWTPGGEITGGTGQALRMATAMNVPIVNLGLAQSNEELERLVLFIDELQQKYKAMVQETLTETLAEPEEKSSHA